MPSRGQRFLAFFTYPIVAIKWAARYWWSHWGAVLTAAGIAAFVVVPLLGVATHSYALSRWPSLRTENGVTPMDSLIVLVCYGIVPSAVLAAATFIVCLAFAPSQVHLEQQDEITSLKSSQTTREQQLQIELDKTKIALQEALEKPRRTPPNERQTLGELRREAERRDAESEDQRRRRLAREAEQAELEARLPNVRQALSRQADSAPKESEYTPEKGRAWVMATQAMLQSIAPGASHRFNSNNFGMRYTDLMYSVSSLVAIVGGLTVRDLRR